MIASAVRSAAAAAAALLTLLATSLDAQDPMMDAGMRDMTWGRTTFLMSEVLEYAPGPSERPVAFDLLGWSGGAVHRLWFKADGRVATVGQGTDGEYQAMYGKLIRPFWDVQVGVRTDVQSAGGTTRTLTGAVVGLQGLVPGWFEIEPSLFIPTDGNVQLDFTGSYDVYFTQRLVVQPRLETSFAARDDDRRGVSQGLSSGSVALRTRYEWRREFAPYAGIVWERAYGRAGDLARLGNGADRGSAGETSFVIGLRVWR